MGERRAGNTARDTAPAARRLSAAATFGALAALQVGEPVPSDLYVLDYADGTRPRWVVDAVEELDAGVRWLRLVDRENADDLLPVAVNVVAWAKKTLRSQPYLLGGQPAPMLCDMGQQARAAGRAR